MSDVQERARVGLKYRPRIKGAERVEVARSLRRAYEGGATIRALAARRTMSYGLVYALLKEAKTEFRGRGGRVSR